MSLELRTKNATINCHYETMNDVTSLGIFNITRVLLSSVQVSLAEQNKERDVHSSQHVGMSDIAHHFVSVSSLAIHIQALKMAEN